ncbi:hypothetical protein M3Y97_00107000 [Aphelenchoides bicaudatus]|nr:hypothetical protein M3Y97_00107000 [Aphelenchoides bicaudatus]
MTTSSSGLLDNDTEREITAAPVRLAEEVLKRSLLQALSATNTQIESIANIVDFVIQILVYVVYGLVALCCLLLIALCFLILKQRRKDRARRKLKKNNAFRLRISKQYCGFPSALLQLSIKSVAETHKPNYNFDNSNNNFTGHCSLTLGFFIGCLHLDSMEKIQALQKSTSNVVIVIRSAELSKCHWTRF